MTNIIKINNLKKAYHTPSGEIQAIKNISLDVKKGSFVSIVGSSGCGKSTLLNIIAGLDKKSGGSIIYEDGIRFGYMLQEDALLDHLTVLDNALLGLKLLKINNKENTDYVISLIHKYGLSNFIDKYPYELSGGMKQRVALIRTIATKPDVLLLDEAFSALDYQSRLFLSQDVYNLVKEENITVIMITHDIAEAISLSDIVYVLTKRPAQIKSVYKIEMTNKSNPIDNRKAKEFPIYYEKIWRDLDVSI